MITQNYQTLLTIPTILNQYAEIEKILFFDIETTGLSPKNSFVYLISYGYFNDGNFHLTQLFAENCNDEINILNSFEDILSQFILIAQFNGNKFDIPYLIERFRYHNIISSLPALEPFDIYVFIKQFKQLFDLPNCKLKTFEKFLKLKRDDQIDGGEAINEYYNYISTGNADSLRKCLLHNYEDVLNLPAISELVIFDQLKNPDNFNIITDIDNEYITLSVITESNLNLCLNYCYDDLEFNFKHNIATLKFKIVENTFKLRFYNYKNYVFLNNENYAVEKEYAKVLNLKNTRKCTVCDAYQFISINNADTSDIKYIWSQTYNWMLTFIHTKKA